MNWILIGVIVLLTQKENYASIYGMANPVPHTGPSRNINPFIRHWEAADFDRTTLDDAHQHHIKQIQRRKKRELNSSPYEYEKVNIIKLNFFAHDREFRLILRQDPMSVFATDIEIENTEGPIDYDVSRIYTGSLEDDENSSVHAILTEDNLLDGTISTNTEQYYIEPSNRYSDNLLKSGIHTIVYKLSDVKMIKNSDIPTSQSTESSSSTSSSSSILTNFNNNNNNNEHCASEKLRKKLLIQLKNKNKKLQDNKNLNTVIDNDTKNFILFQSHKNDDNNDMDNDDVHVSVSYKNRHKRWLPDELTDNQNPPLPLDLEMPYNDDMSMFVRHPNYNNNNSSSSNNNNNNNNNNSNNNNSKNEMKNDNDNEKSKIDRPELDYVTRIRSNNPNINNNNNNYNINNNNNNNSNNNNNNISNINNQYDNDSYQRSRGITGSIIFNTKQNRNRNILLSDYNPNNSDLNLNSRSHLINRNYNNNNNNNNNNILVNNFNSSLTTRFNNFFNNNNNNNNNGIYNFGIGSSTSSRPSHKTHVEIITKNGATKKPNIIVNNYNPDILLTSQNFNSHLNLNIRNDINDMNSARTTTTSTSTSYDKKSTCMLYLQADHTFYQKMGSDEASIEAITRHVQRANAIYRNTDFNGDGKPDNITFMIKRIKVHNNNALKDPTYRFPGNYGVEKFLELFSEEDYDAFCLAYMFTYRDFEMGTLGLAWTGDLKNAGGVCEKNGHYRGSLKSLNTGIVTLLNYGKHVPPAVSHVTLAHEIGHNFGSPHDPEQCTPGGEDGNYIMFARATSGDKRNNNKFSPCSLKAIEPVLNAKARSAKGCFTEPQQSICGNGVVEPGEQCDCGWEEDCKDSCCFPMSRHPRPDEKPCTLTAKAMCSPSQGPCCTADCSLKFGDKCRDDNGCRDPSFCDGRMPQCPPSVNKPNKTICNKEFVCYMGECTGSICLAYGLESCQCLPGPNDPKTKSCELCCKQPGEGNICKSSFEWNEPPYDVPDMFAKPGTPCNDYNGYCDVFQKCREVDPSGPLATLRKLLLSEESIASFKKWFHTNWYTVGLAAAGFVVLLILSMKLLGKRSSTKLKSVTIIHSATTETVRLPEDNNGVIVHTTIRTKVPFKKKVRGERSANKTKILNKNNNGNGNGNGNGKNIKPQLLTTSINANGQIITKTKNSTKPLSKRTSAELPKKSVRKKNRISAPTIAEEQQQNKLNELKKNKKNKKHNKEIIDYSNNLGNHMNTFGKVQKWLLESPIVAQPLSHIEHSSKVQKIISKSQSTPERLVQKSPKKTKSVGNLSNEKVKLQVVYKPPFKFSLKLSKNSAIKTHVIGGALARNNNNNKRKNRPGDKKGRIGAAPLSSSSMTNNINNGINNKIMNEKCSRRAALLLRSLEDDCKNLTVNNSTSEPTYETLNPKSNDNPYYENLKFDSNLNTNTSMNGSNDEQFKQQQQQQQQQQQTQQQLQLQQNNDESEVPIPSSSKSATFRVNRSASNNNLDHQLLNSQQINKNQQSNQINYNRSNSATNNPFNVMKPSISNIRKFSDNSVNLNRNFGSTQNLLPSSSSSSSQNLFFKSKKRNSLNLKSSINTTQNDLNRSNLPLKRTSNSNLNLKRENSSSNITKNNEFLPITKIITGRNSIGSNNSCNNINNFQQKLTTTQSSSSSLASTSSSSVSRGSISNIPRASLCNSTTSQTTTQLLSGPTFARQTSLNIKIPPPPTPLSMNLSYNNINNPNSNNSINFSCNTPQSSLSLSSSISSSTSTTTANILNTTNNNSNNSNNNNNNNMKIINNSNSNLIGINNIRPHTASCLETRQFEWPNLSQIKPIVNNTNNTSGDQKQQQHQQQQSKYTNKILKDEQSLPSDLEVMVSDVENLVS